MRLDAFKCDAEGCREMKGTGNHWFRLAMTEEGLVVRPWRLGELVGELHMCSDSCVNKTVQQWLGKQKEGTDADRRNEERA